VTLTAPFPDVVNCVLGRLDLAPTCGMGNISQFVPKVRLLAAERLGTPLDAVRVLMVAHHALGPAVVRAQVGNIPPYFLRIEHGGQDVTAAIGADQLLVAPYPRTSGPASHFLTLAEAIAINERSHPFDSIERIEADGTVVFCPAAADMLRVELGYDCDRLVPDESEERAKELMARFWAYAERHGVHLKNDQ
jgi:hypothetical protein